MKRWHQDYYKSHREMRKLHNYVEGSWREQIGRFRKKKAFDCGNTQCGICHQDKFPKRQLTEQEVISKLDFKDQLKDI